MSETPETPVPSPATTEHKKRKNRRLLRKRLFGDKPYADLGWQERKQVEDEETAAAERHRLRMARRVDGGRGKHISRQQPPPAPYNTIQYVALPSPRPTSPPQDHSGPHSPPILDGTDFDHLPVEKRESIDEDGFDAEYDDLMYQTASREELIRRLKEQSAELERLRAQLRQQHK
jgi:hypothetical protein